MTDIEKYALLLARECIEDWAGESWYERNDEWGTDFTDDELLEIVALALRVKVSLPDKEG